MRKRLLAVNGIDVSFRMRSRTRRVLRAVTLRCEAGEITSVIGRSGVGKTTLLKAIAGLLPIEKGQVLLEGREIDGPGPDRSLVFQEYPVFPWLTVLDNVAMGIRFGGAEVEKKKVVDMAMELLKAVGLLPWAQAYPQVLSGGMRQRVALARSLGSTPKVLLLDEPFGALDAVTRVEVQEVVREIHRKQKQAIVLVTHDIAEAVLLSDRICVLGLMGDGREASIYGEWSVERPREYLRPEDLGGGERALVVEVRALLAEKNRWKCVGDE